MRVLISGAFGYLGARLAADLAPRADCEMVLASRRPRIAPWAPRAEVIGIDWSPNVDLRPVCAGVDVVIHLAGMNASESAADPATAIAFKRDGTARLVEAAAAAGARRFVYASTIHVYGSPLVGAIGEHTPAHPTHPYGISHRAAEDAVLAATAGGRIEGVVMRLSNVFGAPMESGGDCWSLLFNDLARQAVTTGRLVLRSDGRQRRDFVTAADACRATTHLAEMPSRQLGDGVFNVGGAWAPTVLQSAQWIAERVAQTIGTVPEVQVGAASEAGAGQLLDYRIDRLRRSGFELGSGSRDSELDRLVRFCASLPA